MIFVRRRLWADMLLLFVSLVWGIGFIPQRIATQHLGAFLFNGLRFLLGAAVLSPILLFRPRPAKGLFRWSALAGGVLVAAAACQQAGMAYTTAGNAGFLTGLYVVLVPVVLMVGWRQRMARHSWAAALLAAGGAYLLSADGGLGLGYGDRLELIGAAFWALHIVLVSRAVMQLDVLWFSVCQYVVAGAVSTLIGLGCEAQTLGGLAVCWWAVAYSGAVSIAIGYTLQAVGQRYAPAADAAVILSMEAVFAALFGILLLAESLAARQYVGCSIIMAAVVLVQIKPAASGATPPAPSSTPGDG